MTPPRDHVVVSVEAERAVLGAVLLTPEAVLTVADILKPDDFALPAHRHVFTAVLALAGRGEAVDVITLSEELRTAGKLEAIGGSAYLSVLDASVPASGNIARHAKIVRDESILRAVAVAGAEVTRLARADDANASEALDAAQAVMLRLVDDRASGALVKAGDTLRDEVIGDLERRWKHRQEHGSAPVGLSSGFERVDSMTGGLHGGDLVVVAGRPSMGKTAWAMNVAANVAIRRRRPVAVFSLEMGRGALVSRILSSEAGVSSERMRDGDLDERDWPKLTRAMGEIQQSPLHIDDSGSTTVLDIRARCRRLKATEGDLALVVIDYLQLMTGSGASREQEVSGLSRGLKQLARELGCPVIALSQLSRKVEERKDKRPMMSDLRESGAIEQDADVCGFLYRDEYYDKGSKDKGVAEFIIGKQRNGPTGTARLKFNGHIVRFDDLEERQ